MSWEAHALGGGRGVWGRGALVALVGERGALTGGTHFGMRCGVSGAIEGLEKAYGVVTLPGQSFDTPDDLVMQIAGGGEGCSDREKTELEQWARHLRVPGTVGTVSRPLEPKHATWGRSEGCCHSSCMEESGSATPRRRRPPPVVREGLGTRGAEAEFATWPLRSQERPRV